MKTGQILWQTPDPVQGLALGSVSTANGLVFVPSMSGEYARLKCQDRRGFVDVPERRFGSGWPIDRERDIVLGIGI